jgi:HD-GYP domain-containing protein (c-di-GMP phosphodiesterase class II)
MDNRPKGLQAPLYDEEGLLRAPSLVGRLGTILVIASLALATAVTYLSAWRQLGQEDAARSDRAVTAARALAQRIAPHLEHQDDLRLAVQVMGTAEGCDGRVLVLDYEGHVRFDTSLAEAGERVALDLRPEPFVRTTTDEQSERLEAWVTIPGPAGPLGQVRLFLSGPPPAAVDAGFWAAFALNTAGFLGFGVVALFALKAILRPVRQVAIRMRRLAAGEHDPLPPAGGLGEAGELTGAFRLLARNLGFQSDRVRDGVVELARPLVHALESLDPARRGHAERVRRLCARIGERLELRPDDRRDLELAALLHDLGKPSRPAGEGPSRASRGVLDRKSGEEDDHPYRAASLLSVVPGLSHVALSVKHHHERFDGDGFPEGLRGERIPLASRIIAMADAFDLLTHAEPAMSWEEALEELRVEEGGAFDPWLLDLFEAEIRKDPRDSSDGGVQIPSEGALPGEPGELEDRAERDETGVEQEWI